MSSCFFREDDGDNVECSTYNNPVYDLTKRKVTFLQLSQRIHGHAAYATARPAPCRHANVMHRRTLRF